MSGFKHLLSFAFLVGLAIAVAFPPPASPEEHQAQESPALG